MYVFYDKRKKGFDKYMEILEKVSNIIKKNDSELIQSKKYLIAKKTFNRKESFQCFIKKQYQYQ